MRLRKVSTLLAAIAAAVLIPATAEGSTAEATAPDAAITGEQCGVSYTVQPGDTLVSVAGQFGTTVEAILACNPDIEDPDVIIPGQVLLIPGAAPPGEEVSTLEAISKAEAEELSPDYVPADLEDVDAALVSPGLGPQRLRADALFWLETMFAAAAAEDHTLGLNSGYRSYAQQEATFQFWVDQLGEEQAELVSARPGRSEHQLGTAADITGPTNGYQLSEEFGDTPEGLWLAANAWRYGYALSYPEGQTEVTGYVYEPWHWRYIGRAHAEAWLNVGEPLILYLRALASHVQGDADCDGDADSVDALAVLRETAGLGVAECAANADVTCSGDRGSTDALAILRYVAGLPPLAPETPCAAIGGLI